MQYAHRVEMSSNPEGRTRIANVTNVASGN